MPKRILSAVLALCLCVGFMASFTACKKGDSSSSPVSSTAIDIPVQVFNVNPLTGLEKTSSYVEGRRPVAIMINNIQKALPQSGIADAEVIYEMVTEGGITRMMAVFSDYEKLGKVGPVRSTRDQFVQFILPMNAICVHIGSSIYATEMLRKYEYPTIDGIYLGTTTFAFDQVRSANGYSNDHCFYTDASLVAQGIAQTGINSDGGTIQLFKFNPPNAQPVMPTDGAATRVDFSFSGANNAYFEYNSEHKVYYKGEFDAFQTDESTGAILSFTNVFVLSTNVTLKPDGLCTEFDFSKGEGVYFSEGKFQKIRWEKGDETAPLKVYDTDGNELTVNTGKSYIAFVDSDTLQKTLTIDGTWFYLPVEPQE